MITFSRLEVESSRVNCSLFLLVVNGINELSLYFDGQVKLEFLVGNVYFLWYPISQRVETQLPLITIMLPCITNLIQDKL